MRIWNPDRFRKLEKFCGVRRLLGMHRFQKALGLTGLGMTWLSPLGPWDPGRKVPQVRGSWVLLHHHRSQWQRGLSVHMVVMVIVLS